MKKSNFAKIAAKKALRKAKSKAKNAQWRKVATIKIPLENIDFSANSFERMPKVSKEKLDTWKNAFLNNTAHLLDTKPCKPLCLPTIAVCMKDFLEANDNSTQKSFNRTFYKDLFIKEVAQKNNLSTSEVMNFILLCTPVLTHSYRSMSECETHYRCNIRYSDSKIVSFDMTIDDYEKLFLIDHTNSTQAA